MTSLDPDSKRPRHAARTREAVVAAARDLFTDCRYEAVTIRDVARRAKFSTGAIFSHFENKEDLWRAAMGTPPPIDSDLTRAAPLMRDALAGLWAIRPTNWADVDDQDQDAWRKAAEVYAAATGCALPDFAAEATQAEAA